MGILLHPAYLIALLIALTVHEFSHALIATRLGDPTPGDHGRLTLNPLAHLDALGALLFLVVHFGWAKPVPINPSYFRHPRRDTLLTALAGPASNLILAAVSFAFLLILQPASAAFSVWDLLDFPSNGPVLHRFFVQLFEALLFVDLALMAFNLIPIPPLDGSNIVQAFIPPGLDDAWHTLMRYGPFILIGLFAAEALTGIPLLSTIIGGIMSIVLIGFYDIAKLLTLGRM